MDEIFKLNLQSRFSYKCTMCSKCCVGKKIQINPYEKLRLARNVGQSVEDFCRNYTNGSVFLAQKEDNKCIFLENDGCSVHKDRPLVCRLFPLGRHILEGGSFYFSNPRWNEMPNGEYGESGTIEEFVIKQGANEYIYFADEYFKFYCVAAKIENDEELAFEAGDIDILGIEKFTEFYCDIKQIDRPLNPNQYANLHLVALYALIGQKYLGELP